MGGNVQGAIPKQASLSIPVTIFQCGKAPFHFREAVR
jgi:hypothetical protein